MISMMRRLILRCICLWFIWEGRSMGWLYTTHSSSTNGQICGLDPQAKLLSLKSRRIVEDLTKYAQVELAAICDQCICKASSFV